MPKFPARLSWHLAITNQKDAYIKARAFLIWLFSQAPTKDWDLIMREMWEKSFQNLLGFVLIAKNGNVVAKLAERLPARFLGIKHLSTIDTNATGFDFAYSNEFIHVVEYTECFTVLVDPEGHFKQVGIGKQRIVSENIRPFTQNQQCGIFRNLIRKNTNVPKIRNNRKNLLRFPITLMASHRITSLYLQFQSVFNQKGFCEG